MEPWEKGVLQGVGLRWGGVRGALLHVLAAQARFFWFAQQQKKMGGAPASQNNVPPHPLRAECTLNPKPLNPISPKH